MRTAGEKLPSGFLGIQDHRQLAHRHGHILVLCLALAVSLVHNDAESCAIVHRFLLSLLHPAGQGRAGRVLEFKYNSLAAWQANIRYVTLVQRAGFHSPVDELTYVISQPVRDKAFEGTAGRLS